MGLGDGVDAVVEAVDEVDVGVAWGSEHDFGAWGAAFGGVGREVVGAEVGFGFDDAAGAEEAVDLVGEGCAEEVAGDFAGVAVVEGSWEGIHGNLSQHRREDDHGGAGNYFVEETGWQG